MKNKRTTIRAIYRRGVLRPQEALDLPENSSVEITIRPDDATRRLQALFKKFHERNRNIPPEQIERDIERAIREVRVEDRKTRKSANRTR
jgi:predicted DNA-binding antitoxin AbrB/MazE fold protein